MSMGWNYVSDLRPPKADLFIPQMNTMGMESHGGIISTRRKPKNSEKTLSQCHFFHHKSHMD
jgi:hypothetical protein